MRTRRALALASFLALQFPGVVRAGPPEQLVQLAMHPSDPNVMVVRYVNGGGGAFVTTDGGKNWKLLCNSALFDPVATRAGALVVTGGSTMIMGTFTGMWHDDGHACGWTDEPQYDGQWIADFAVDPIDPTVTYAVTSSGGKLNGIVRRDKTGKWSDFGTKDNMLISDLHVVPHGSGRRFYLGAVKGFVTPADGGPPMSNYVVRLSDDDGVTWTEHVYGAADGLWHLQAVDPSNPDRIVISIERAEDLPAPAVRTDSVRVSGDQGATFADYLTVTEVGGVVFAPDGRVWIGDAGANLDPSQPQGLWSAPSLDVPATKLPTANYPVQCLDYRRSTDTLYACQRVTFGVVDPADGSFTTSLNVRTVAGFVDCPGVDMAATCQTQLCGAYCGFGHFAQAPVCCAYSSPTCGPAAAQSAICPIPAGTGGAVADGSAGAPTDGGADGSSDAASSGGGGGGSDAGGTAGHGGALGTGGSSGNAGGQGGGCCTVAGRARSGSGATEAFTLAVAALVLRRKRR